MEVDSAKEATKMETEEQPEQNHEHEEEEDFNRFQGGRGGFR